MGVFCLVDNKVVIHIPRPDPGGFGCIADGSSFEVLHEQVGYQRAYGRPHGSPMYLFIKLTLQM